MTTLCEKELCTGCSACFNICNKRAITMESDVEGFLYPEINAGICVDCGLCRKSCPMLYAVVKNSKTEVPLASLTKDIVLRKKSSSGGLFSVLANETFKRGGVVFGAIFDEVYNVSHTVATCLEELPPLRGSKYVQSIIGTTYKIAKSFLNDGRYVLFTGTPCQIAGLRSYLANMNQEKLITVDLVCHGVPSAKAFQMYLKKLAEYKGWKQSFKDFSFRELEGWGVTPSFQFTERRKLSHDENLYMRLFLGNYLHRPACYKCQFATPERVSDITIADFWKIGSEKKFAYETKYGVSLVLLNSDKGESFYDSVRNQLYDDQRTWNEALLMNHQLYQQSKRPKKRDKAFNMLFNKPYVITYFFFCDNPYLRFRRVVGNILRRLHLR